MQRIDDDGQYTLRPSRCSEMPAELKELFEEGPH